MPLNEIESHPYLDYFIEHHGGVENVPWEAYTKMIVGSFPIYAITQTVYPFEEHRHQAADMEMPFFYGSPTNSFWTRLAETFFDGGGRVLYPPGREGAIQLLEENNLLLTDVVKKTNRFKVEKGIRDPYSPADGALLNRAGEPEVVEQFELNNSIVDWLIKGVNIRSIYFTAQKAIVGKNPGGWFHQILVNNNIRCQLLNEMPNALQYRIFNEEGTLNKEITLFFLPTPSGSRSIAFTPNIQHPMFVNYLISVDALFYQTLVEQGFLMNQEQKELLRNLRCEFLEIWWRKFLVEEDWQFDGTIVHLNADN